ncbi:MAG: SDR family oxidoreductase [Candidatus Omnitrophota bacterium]|jgi:enoyl-[acyl-carrier protein] reductase III
MDKVLKDQVALVTGGSRGIGRAIALELAGMGAHVAVNYVRNQEAAEEVVKAVTQKGVRAVALQANVGDVKAIDELVKSTVLEFGGIDIVVHSAALGAFKPVHLLKANQWELSLDINAKAFYLLAQKTIPIMQQRGGGSLLGISSLGSHRIIPNYGAIGVSKAALETLVKYLAFELAPKNIRVNCISGGLVDTDALKFFPGYEMFREEVVKRTPAGRIGTPEDLAKVAGFLVSPAAGWIVGQTVIADGGLSLI